MSKRVKWAISLAVLGLGLAACATAPTPQERNLPIRLAFEEPLDSLRQKSDAGDRQAQYALGLLMKFGLRGVEQDSLGAEALRAHAGRTINRTQPIYVPSGVKGGTGTLMNVNTSSPGISDVEARRMDLCAAMVLSASPAIGGQICGSAEAYIELMQAASPVRQQMLQPQPIEPASVTSCETIAPLWSRTALHMTMGEIEAAAAGADRIIELCGTDEASWHARVMRAVIHLQADEPAKAVFVLEPVPTPAPRPIGAYGAHVRMAAEARLENWEAFARIRDQMTRASIEALKQEDKTQLLDRFEVAGRSVSLFQRRGNVVPGVTSEMVALVEQSDPRVRPVSYILTQSSMMGAEGGYFLDEFRCEGRGVLMHFAQMPKPEMVRQQIEKRLNGELDLISASLASQQDVACQWPAQTSPGLGDDPALRVEYSL